MDLRESLVFAAFEDTSITKEHTQRSETFCWCVGDEVSRADIEAGCRTSDEALRPLIMGSLGENSDARELFIDFNKRNMGWHYKWSVAGVNSGGAGWRRGASLRLAHWGRLGLTQKLGCVLSLVDTSVHFRRDLRLPHPIRRSPEDTWGTVGRTARGWVVCGGRGEGGAGGGGPSLSL